MKKNRGLNILKSIFTKEDGASGCLILLLIVFIFLIAAGAMAYIQWTNIRDVGLENIRQVFKVIEDLDDINLDEIDDLDDIEELEVLEDIDLEKIQNLSPIILDIYQMIPQNLFDFIQNRENGDDKAEDYQESEIEIILNESDLLPDSISSPPLLTLKKYQEFSDIPEVVFAEIGEDYINRNSILLDYESDFPEREIEELRELEQITEDISDSMIEEEKTSLERFYNLEEVFKWYEERLIDNGWEVVAKTNDYSYHFEHKDDGYFIIVDVDIFLYTPKI